MTVLHKTRDIKVSARADEEIDEVARACKCGGTDECTCWPDRRWFGDFFFSFNFRPGKESTAGGPDIIKAGRIEIR